MRILINAERDKLELYSRSTGEEFLALDGPGASGDVAVVVRGAGFGDSLKLAVGLGMPVVVICGSYDERGRECASEAARWGIPEPCIVVKDGESIRTLDGRKIAESARGIGVRAVLEAVRYALENGLCPEPLVWDEEGDTADEPLVFTEPEPPEALKHEEKVESPKPAESGGTKPRHADGRGKVVSLIKGGDARQKMDGLLETSRRVVVVLKATPDADSGRVAKELAENLNGLHLEVSGSPRSYVCYAESPEKAAETGRYSVFTGTSFVGSSYTAGSWLVVELDAAVLPEIPDLVDAVYNKAERVIHAVGSFREGEAAVKTWLDSGWKLDAVVPTAGFERFKEAFGKLVYPSASALALQFAY